MANSPTVAIFLTLTAQLLVLPSPAIGAAEPQREVAAVIKTFFGSAFTSDWRGIETLPGIVWAPLPPNMLQNCLPDGGCFTRQGKAVIGGRPLVAIATGARTMVNNLYVRSASPFGDAAVLASLRGLGVSVDLVRCPIQDTAGGTKWYRLKSSSGGTGILSVVTRCNGAPCELFVLTQGDELPALPPAQLKLYSEQCAVAPAQRTPVATVLPHEALAQTLAVLIPPAGGPVLRDWNTLRGLPTGIVWLSAAPQRMDLSFRNDSNPVALSANLALSGRKFSLLVSGSPAQPKTIHVEESGMHPRGEHLLGVLHSKGFAVELLRCGPVYTESTNNWYRVRSAGTHPVVLRQSIRYEGSQVQDSYELRLDDTLPARGQRDRDPGAGGCR